MTRAAVALCALAGAAAMCAEERPTWVEPASGIRFVRLEAGTFVMGTPAYEPLREAQERPHEVRLSRPFWLGATEVTQEQWRRVMGTRPSALAGCGDCPVENVNALEIEAFLEALDARAPGERFRLPTEAQWEYACRAGTSTPFAFGARLTTGQANVHGHWPYPPGGTRGTYRGRPLPVASFASNRWGLFDLHGNVWEWTADQHCPYPEAPVQDPLARCGASLRVIRGGSWAFGADSARCGLRYTHAPSDRGPSLGFRVVREEPRRAPRPQPASSRTPR